MSIIKVRNELGEFVEIPTLQGPQGDTGIGIPTGGTTGQILSKNSDSDYDTRWIDNNGGSGGTSDYNELSNKPIINLTGTAENPITLGTFTGPGLYVLRGYIELPLIPNLDDPNNTQMFKGEVLNMLINVSSYYKEQNMSVIMGIILCDDKNCSSSIFNWIFDNTLNQLIEGGTGILATIFDIPYFISAFENDVNYINSIGPSKDRIKSIQVVDTLPEVQEPNVLYLVKQNDTPSVEYDTSPVMELGTISRSTGATDESVDDIRTKDYVYIGGIKSLTINNGLNKTSRVHLYDKDKVYITNWYEEAGVKYSYRSIENGSPLTNIPSNAVYMKFKISYNQVKDVEVSYEV